MIVFPEPSDNEVMREFGGSLLPTTTGQAALATIKDRKLRLAEMLYVQKKIEEADPQYLPPGFNYRLQFGEGYWDVPDEGFRQIDPDTLNERYKHLGLKFTNSMSQESVDVLVDYKKQDLIRQDIINRGPDHFGASLVKFGAALAGGLADPANILIGLIPVGPAAKWAALSARIGVTGMRAARGAIEGAVGNILLEPGVYALSRQQQLDYTMADALLNVTIGSVLGAGIRPIAGKIGDVIRERRAPAVVEELSADERLAAFNTAVAQLREGRRVDMDAFIDTRLRGTTALTPLRIGQPIASVEPTVMAPTPIVNMVGAETPALIPVTSRSGKTVPRFNTEAQALFRAQELGLDPELVVAIRDAEGKFALAERTSGIELVRDEAGAPRLFPSRQAARGYLKRRGATLEDLQRAAVVPFEDKYAIVRGLYPEDIERIKTAPSLFRFGDVVQPEIPTEPRFGRLTDYNPEEIRATARSKLQDQDKIEALLDGEEYARVVRDVERIVNEKRTADLDDPVVAKEEADYQQNMLRQSGFDETQFSEKSLEDMEFLRKMDESDFDESYKKGVNAVAHCLLRTS